MFDGGTQASTPGDSLTLTGGTFATGTFAFTNANDGTINLTGNSQISYTGLEPIVTTGTTINDLILTFANLSSSLTINAGTGNDIVNITSVDTLCGGADNDSLNGGDGVDYLYGDDGADTITTINLPNGKKFKLDNWARVVASSQFKFS